MNATVKARERERTRFVVMLSENSSAQKIYYE